MTEADKTMKEIEKEEKRNVEFGFRSGNLFAIDATKEMFIERGENGSYFLQCLWIYERILRQKLSLNKLDWMGLVIFGSRKSDNDTQNIFTVLKFNPVTKAMLTDLKTFMAGNLTYERFSSTTNYPIANVILYSARAYDAVKVTMVTRQVNLMTCLDNPVPDDNDERHKARLTAKNFKDISVKLHVIGLGENFNYEFFYKELMNLADRFPDQDFKPIQLNDIEETVLRKAHVVGNLDFKIANKIKIKVSLQGFSTKRRFLNKVWMHKETNEILEKVSYYKSDDVDFPDEDDEENPPEVDIFDNNVRKSQKFGDKEIIFTPKEVIDNRHIINRGIELLGFKPMFERDPEFHIAPPYFVGCQARASNGEKQLFTQLLSSCVKKNVMAICVIAARDVAAPYLCMMWPCENFGGFYLYKMPYKENVRELQELMEGYMYEEENPPYNEETLELMSKIVRKCRVKYDPSLFENPKSTKMLAYIESIAMDEEFLPDNYPDRTLLPAELMRERLQSQKLIDRFNAMFPPDEMEAFRRGRQVVPRYDQEQAMQLVREGHFLKHTNAILKAVLKALNLPATGLKQDLVTRLQEFKQTL